MTLKLAKFLIVAGALLLIALLSFAIHARMSANAANRRADQADQERAATMNDFHTQEGKLDALKSDTFRLGQTIREKSALITLREKSLVNLLKREKQANEKNSAIMLFSDERMDSIFRARFPEVDSLHR